MTQTDKEKIYLYDRIEDSIGNVQDKEKIKKKNLRLPIKVILARN